MSRLEGIQAALDAIQEAEESNDPLAFNRGITQAISHLYKTRVQTIFRYHFSMGNSTHGPVGMTAQILTNSKRNAVKRLVDILEDLTGPDGEIELEHDGLREGEYITIFVNTENVVHNLIDEYEELI